MRLLFVLCCVSISVPAQELSGKLNIPEGWSDRVYLSLVSDYREMEIVQDDHIIATTVADSTGFFAFERVFTVKNQIYALHVSPEADETEVFISDFSPDGFGKNVLVFTAGSEVPVTVQAIDDQQIFGEVQPANSGADTWQKLDELHLQHVGASYDLDAEAKGHLIHGYHNDIVELVQNLPVLSRLMGCKYLIEEEMNLSSDYLASYESHQDFCQKVQHDLETEYPDFARRLEKEMALVDFQLAGDEGTRWTKREVFLAVFSLLLLALVGFLLVKIKNIKGNVVSGAMALTAREEKIKQYILSGKSNKEIANELFISLSTVKTHINTLYKKEGVSSRKELQTRNSR